VVATECDDDAVPTLPGDRRLASLCARGAAVLALLAVGLSSCTPAGGSSWTWSARRTAPGRGDLDAASCPAATACVALVGSDQSARLDGSTWSAPVPIEQVDRADAPEAVADSSGLVAVSCPSTGLCFAIDGQSDEVFRYLDGRWGIAAGLPLSTPQGGSEPNTLAAISCGSAHFCVVLDDFGEAFTYDGTWSGPHIFDSIADGEDALSCTAGLVCVLVDDNDNAIVDENGGWGMPHHLEAAGTMLVGVSCAPQARCVAFDGRGGYFVGQSTKKG